MNFLNSADSCEVLHVGPRRAVVLKRRQKKIAAHHARYFRPLRAVGFLDHIVADALEHGLDLDAGLLEATHQRFRERTVAASPVHRHLIGRGGIGDQHPFRSIDSPKAARQRSRGDRPGHQPFFERVVAARVEDENLYAGGFLQCLSHRVQFDRKLGHIRLIVNLNIRRQQIIPIASLHAMPGKIEERDIGAGGAARELRKSALEFRFFGVEDQCDVEVEILQRRDKIGSVVRGIFERRQRRCISNCR